MYADIDSRLLIISRSIEGMRGRDRCVMTDSEVTMGRVYVEVQQVCC